MGTRPGSVGEVHRSTVESEFQKDSDSTVNLGVDGRLPKDFLTKPVQYEERIFDGWLMKITETLGHQSQIVWIRLE